MARWQFKEERAYFLYVTIEADSKEEAIEKFHEGDWEWDNEGDEDTIGRYVCEVDENDDYISDDREEI